MYVSWRRLYRLSWSLLACCSSTGNAASDSTIPESVEFDFIFPRNETYAPAPLFPFVFAVQNSRFAAAL